MARIKNVAAGAAFLLLSTHAFAQIRVYKTGNGLGVEARPVEVGQ
jgi:hypothetical protein